jgi:hypothetical protein
MNKSDIIVANTVSGHMGGYGCRCNDYRFLTPSSAHPKF